MKAPTFSRSALVLLLASATALFALSALLSAWETRPVSSGSAWGIGSRSVSAIGHAGFYDILRRLDRPVARSVGQPLARAGSRGTLIVAEPLPEHMTNADEAKLMSAPRLLFVLPKWRGVQDKKNADWISEAKPVPLLDAQYALSLVADARSVVVRGEWPEVWETSDAGFVPEGSGFVQLIRSETLKPLISCDDGILVGEIADGNRKIVILSDPDLLSNHGIVKGDNAALMLDLVDTLRFWKNDDRTAPIVFDETVHGFREARKESPVRLLFEFPFAIVTILTCCSAVLLLLAGTGRFGAPVLPEPVPDFGKANLIANGARLLDYAGHHAVVLRRYVRMTIRSVAHGLHAPGGLDEPSLAAWLDRIGMARGTGRSCASILRNSDAPVRGDDKNLPRLFESARDIHLWKGEILDGSESHRRDR